VQLPDVLHKLLAAEALAPVKAVEGRRGDLAELADVVASRSFEKRQDCRTDLRRIRF